MNDQNDDSYEDRTDLTKFDPCITIFRRDCGEETSSFAFRLDDNLPTNDLPFLVVMLIRNFVDMYDPKQQERVEAEILQAVNDIFESADHNIVGIRK